MQRNNRRERSRSRRAWLWTAFLFVIIRTTIGFWMNTPSAGAVSQCDQADPDRLLNFGAPDLNHLPVLSGRCFDAVLPTAITNSGSPDYDFVFYERYIPNRAGIELDWIELQLSSDQRNWKTVFYWGDTNHSNTDNTNIAAYGRDRDGEQDNEFIPGRDLYGNQIASGILIDIDRLGLTGSYQYLRITGPAKGDDPSEMDAIVPLDHQRTPTPTEVSITPSPTQVTPTPSEATATPSPTQVTPTGQPTTAPTVVTTEGPTETPGPTQIGGSTETPTNTPADTPTSTAANTPTNTPINTPTNTTTNTPTSTATNAPTRTPSPALTSTPTRTLPPRPTLTPSNIARPVDTPIPTSTPQTPTHTPIPPTNQPPMVVPATSVPATPMITNTLAASIVVPSTTASPQSVGTVTDTPMNTPLLPSSTSVELNNTSVSEITNEPRLPTSTSISPNPSVQPTPVNTTPPANAFTLPAWLGEVVNHINYPELIKRLLAVIIVVVIAILIVLLVIL